MSEPPIPAPGGGGDFFDDALINLSHELRTPLAAIQGYTSSVLRYEQRLTPDERREMLSEIAQACTRMETLIDGTLHAALALRGDLTLQYDAVDLVALTRNAIQQLTDNTPAAAADFALHIAATPVVWGDIRWLSRAIVQLLDNARRYAPAASQATIAIDIAADRALWSITDQGIGISAVDLPHIFTPFYRVERQAARESSGLGLGLAMCQRIVTLHGGTISATSSPGTMSRFTFALPLFHSDVAPPMSHDAP